MSAQDQTKWWFAAEVALAAAIVSGVVCLGGAPAWTTGVLLALSVCALSAWVIGAARTGRRATWHPFLLIPLGMCVAAAFSLIPLPDGLLALLSPVNAEVRDFALVPLGLEGHRPVTVDPPSTWRALARLLSLSSLAFVALQLGRLRGVKGRVLAVIAAMGGLTMLVGLAHGAVGADAFLGQWRYSANLPLLSFFGNQNHLAAFLAFAATLALGFALDVKSREVAARWGALALFCGVGVFLSLSRGGIATFLVTWGLVGAVVLARRQGGLRASLPWLVIGATGLFALSLASEPLLERLASVSSIERLEKTKLELWPEFWTAARAYWRVGMGLGGFEHGFARFQTQQLGFTFTHPENLFLQRVSELGIPLSLVLLAVGGVIVRRLSRQVRGATLEAVALGAVAGAGLHDLFDFALELNALSVACAVTVGVCASREPPQGAEAARARVSWRWLALPLVVFMLGVLGLSRGLPLHTEIEARLLELASESRPADDVRRAALEAIDRHPVDWVLYSVVAHRLSEEGNAREALAWANRVLFLRPGDARVHVAVGRALVRLQQPAQALLEFKTALLMGDSTSLDEGLILAAQTRLHDRLLVETPGLLTRLWERTLQMGRLADGEALLAAVESLPPSSEVELEARVLRVRQAASEKRFGAAVAAYEVLPPEAQSTQGLVVHYAQALAAEERVADAVAVLERAHRANPQELRLALSLAQLLGQAGRTADGRAVLDRVRPFVMQPGDRSLLFVHEADLWLVERRFPRAIEALKTAARIEPSRADLRYRVAQAYELSGSLRSALDELKQARQLDTPTGAASRDAWVSRLEAALRQERPE